MQVLKIPVGMIGTNCMLAYDEVSRQTMIVDPGDDASRLLKTVDELQLSVSHILLTHGHFDHILALAALKRATNALVCIHALDADMLLSADQCLLGHFYASSEGFVPVKADIVWNGGETLYAAGTAITVHHTPGHTPGSVCYDTGSVLFSGDTLFASSCGRCDLPGGNTKQMLASLLYLSDLPGDRIVYPGHENETTLDAERRGNYAMRRAMDVAR